ncbi:hypothetical protein OOK31_37740 [Streptomyces sp. NBC_00249]|uniref:hypothetical protein n=1 Tax=Streptomyces sp. NBC_00249 TaxID=2975690 RepID=UPI0022539FDB|nr:hypothetical protein [Streptomyces sp. NBC_00249]MCX5199557.1 hypothetical protein [Streptomyces sp. NBC_00249]
MTLTAAPAPAAAAPAPAARSVRRPSGFVSLLVLLAGALLLYLSLPNVGNALRSATADGVAGTFTASRLSCIRHPGHETCEWSGTFRAADGTGLRENVKLYGTGRGSLGMGRAAAAVDVGNPGRVYRPGGSYEWIFTFALLAGGYALLAVAARRHLMPPPLPAGPAVTG